ncbi:MAG TPA: hypothetical protein VJA94_24295 [Candidatus Angelobacter sp.]
MAKRRGALVQLLLVLIGGGALFYAIVVLTNPWSVHMGGRWTPLLTWQGSGRLLTKGGVEYPLYVQFYPSSHFSHLHLDGLRPVGGLQGSAWLCTARGASQRLNLSGTIYGAWSSTENNLVAFRLLEPKPIDLGQAQGFFDLTGRWHGQQLVLDDPSHVPAKFRSGLTIEHPSVTLDWGKYSDFKAMCASATISTAHQ